MLNHQHSCLPLEYVFSSMVAAHLLTPDLRISVMGDPSAECITDLCSAVFDS